MTTKSSKMSELRTSGELEQLGENCSDAVLNDNYDSQSFKEQFLKAWKSQENFDCEVTQQSKEMIVTNNPFNCALLPNIIKEEKFLHNVVQELNKLDMKNKRNDLYKFKLSNDLNSENFGHIQKLCSFFKRTLKPWMENITGLKLTENIPLSCSQYKYTDTLLCHDDKLEGRRIAFILYLVPPWKKSYGGSLDLFNTDKHSRPWNIEKQIYPLWNSFAFFEVSSISFHQVSEILVKDKTRLSINGWFHGDPIHYPPTHISSASTYILPGHIEEKKIYEWINPLYLDEATQSDVRKKFIRDSEIELDNFLKLKKYEKLAKCLASTDCQWTWIGPPNRKHYEILHREKAPTILKKFLKLLHSEAMFLIISQLTGLQLHRLAPPTEESESELSDDELSDTAEQYSSSDEMELNAGISQKRKFSAQSKNPKKPKLNCKMTKHSFADGWESDVEREFLESLKNANSTGESGMAESSSQIIQWSRGTYSIMRDDDNTDGRDFTLDSRFFCNADQRNSEMGGTKHYVAKGEEDELITIIPTSNSLSLVYKDKETYQFTRHINYKGRGSSYQEVYAQYREIGQSSSSS